VLVVVLSIAALEGIASGREVPRGELRRCAHENAPQGQDAVDQIGKRMTHTARRMNKSKYDLERMLLSDPSLRYHNCSNENEDDSQPMLFYMEPKRHPNETETDHHDHTHSHHDHRHAALRAVSADSFALHSRPNASKKICLDFRGRNISNSSWSKKATIVAPPFSCDGNSNDFSASERSIIARAWGEVAEQFSPFDVDVTTDCTEEDVIRRDATDAGYGCWAVITPLSQLICNGTCGGIAFLGTFDTIGAQYQPTFVMSDNLNCNAKFIAMAVSHECGHTMGLSHDGSTCATAQGGATSYYAGQGSGPTSWAPVMGVGYTKSRVMWNAGDYTCANNKEDDLAKLAAALSYRSDDTPSKCSAAPLLPLSPTADASTSGVIERSGDNDTFAVAVPAGRWTLSVAVDVAPLGPALDVIAALLDSDCLELTVFNPSDSLGVPSTAFDVGEAVRPRVHHVRVRGVGRGSPLSGGYSEYGSLGQYTLTVRLTKTLANGTNASFSTPPTSSLQSSSPPSDSTKPDNSTAGARPSTSDALLELTVVPSPVTTSIDSGVAESRLTTSSSPASSPDTESRVGSANTTIAESLLNAASRSISLRPATLTLFFATLAVCIGVNR